jgi:RNA polymerase sigma factor (sigma-70 family)
MGSIKMAIVPTDVRLGQNLSPRFEDEIKALLIAFTGLHPVKKLFWELLGFNRRDELISLTGLKPDLRSCVIEARLFASHDQFLVFSVVLTSAGETPDILRRIFRFFRLKHRYLAVLIGDAGQNGWRMIYQPENIRSARASGRVVSVSIGHRQQNPRRQSKALAKLRTYDEDDEPIGLLELVAAFDELFLPLALQPANEKRVLDTFEFLVRQLASYPVLTANQERALIVRFVDMCDALVLDENGRETTHRVPEPDCIEEYFEVRDKLVLHNLRLCFQIAKDFAWNREEILDLFEAGVIGMMRAIDRIDPARGTRFSTYASHWIRNYVRMTARELHTIIHVPTYLYRLPTNERPRLIFRSLSAIEGTDEGDSVRDLVDSSELTPSSEMEWSERSAVMQELLTRLSDREAAILRRRFGMDGHRRETLSEVGVSMNLTKERVRQLELRALARLKELLTSRGYDED